VILWRCQCSPLTAIGRIRTSYELGVILHGPECDRGLRDRGLPPVTMRGRELRRGSPIVHADRVQTK
jgi:hypothetical protein